MGLGSEAMEPKGATTTLKRKMAAGQGEAPSGGRSMLRALRLALARAGRDVFGLPLAVIGARQGRAIQETLARYLDDNRLLMLLDGPDRAIGAASVDRSCLAALIQRQTMGTVTGMEPVERGFTGTDAALVAPLIDATIKRATVRADLAADRHCISGFRFGARVSDVRALLLALEAERCRVFDLTAEFAGGKSQGTVCLVFPELIPIPTVGSSDGSGRMERAIAKARADLMAVVGHLRLPLAELSHLRVGDVLPLTIPHLDRADLVSIDGRSVVSARLGQAGGMRALRLNEIGVAEARSERKPDFRPNSPVGEAHDAVTLDLTALPDMPDLPVWEDDEASRETINMDGFPLLDNADDGSTEVDAIDPRAAAVEISSLAGIPAEGDSDDMGFPAMAPLDLDGLDLPDSS